jgi:hypothetical protein
MRTRGLAVAGWVVVLLASPLGPAAAQEDPQFLMEPADDSSTGESGYYIIEAEPGDVIEQSVILGNESDEHTTLSLAAVDADTGLYGGVDYGLPEDEVTRVGSWITLEESEVVLAPGRRENISFEVMVPEDAASGQHVGGLAAFVPTTEQGGDEVLGEDEAGAAIVVQSRRVIAVQVNLPGDDTPVVEITEVAPTARADGLYLEIAMTNVGHGLTKGEGLIELPEEGFSAEFALDTFVPGTSISYPVRWAESADDGEYAATVTLDYDDGQTAEFSGTFLLGEEVQEALDDRQVGAAPGEGEGAAASSSPLGLILIAAVAAGLGMAGTAVMMKRKQVPAAAPSAEDDP